MSDFQAILTILIATGICWFFWRVWISGAQEAREFDEEKRREQGLCATCGYDIRAGHDVCPECGTPTQREPQPLDPEALDIDALRNKWPVDLIKPKSPWPGEAITIAHETNRRVEAFLLSVQFKSRGMWSRAEERNPRQYRGLKVFFQSRYVVVVLAEDFDRAKKILDTYRNKNTRSELSGPGAGRGVSENASAEADPTKLMSSDRITEAD